MAPPDRLDVDYRSHDRVQRLIDVVRFCLEGVGLSVDRWDEPDVRGPGLYFAVVSGQSVADYADAMGTNRWPTDAPDDVLADVDGFSRAASTVARSRDGAVVVGVDGIVQEQLVRFRDLPSTAPDGAERPVRYADWMGARHMSAADTSARDAVVTTLTLSGESGRVTVFEDGAFDSTERGDVARRWR